MLANPKEMKDKLVSWMAQQNRAASIMPVH